MSAQKNDLENSPSRDLDAKEEGVEHEHVDNKTSSPSSSHGAAPATTKAEFVYVKGSPEEKALVRKMDLRLFPILWCMYVINYLDRTNIGNAKVGGMEDDLALSSGDYSLALLIFFIGYLLFEIPSNMILSRSRPSIYLPAIMFTWGCVTIAFKGINSLKALVAIRFFLGIAESGFFPGVWFLLSSWYRREELARRMAVFYSASIMSGAFGGILAGVITEHMEDVAGIRGWKWLFMVEGFATIAFAIIALFLLPDFPQTTRWLTDEQKVLAAARLKAQEVGEPSSEELEGKSNGRRHWEDFLKSVSDWRTWAFTLGYMTQAGAGTISYFIPTLAESMGYEGRKAQFMSAPPYACTFVLTLINCYFADFHERYWHIAPPLVGAGVSCIIMGVVSNHTVEYIFLCFGAIGIWSSLPVWLAYLSDSIPYPAGKRAVSIAIVNSIGNLSSVYGAYLWPSGDAPRYHKGFGVTAAFCFLSAITSLVVRAVQGPIRTEKEIVVKNEGEGGKKGMVVNE